MKLPPLPPYVKLPRFEIRRHIWFGLLVGVVLGASVMGIWATVRLLRKASREEKFRATSTAVCLHPGVVRQVSVTSPTENTWEMVVIAVDTDGRVWLRKGDERPACWVQISPVTK